MQQFIIRRLLNMLLVLLLSSIVSFIVVELPPGDYSTVLRGQLEAERLAPEQIEAQVRPVIERFALDKPVPVRFWRWFSSIITFNFGYSMVMKQPIADLLNERLALTMAVSFVTLVFIMVVGIAIGMFSAVKQYSGWDYLFTVIGFIGMATPNFLLALIILFVSVMVFGSTSVGGLFSAEYLFAPWSWAKVVDFLKHIWVVVVIIGTAGTAGTIRVMRAQMLDVLSEPYMDTARMKGLSSAKVYFKHGLRVAINPIVSSIGLSFPGIISGATIVSLVLLLPLVGPLLLDALMSEDMYLASTIIVLLTFALVVGNFLADLTLAWLDPRIRLEN